MTGGGWLKGHLAHVKLPVVFQVHASPLVCCFPHNIFLLPLSTLFTISFSQVSPSRPVPSPPRPHSLIISPFLCFLFIYFFPFLSSSLSLPFSFMFFFRCFFSFSTFLIFSFSSPPSPPSHLLPVPSSPSYLFPFSSTMFSLSIIVSLSLSHLLHFVQCSVSTTFSFYNVFSHYNVLFLQCPLSSMSTLSAMFSPATLSPFLTFYTYLQNVLTSRSTSLRALDSSYRFFSLLLFCFLLPVCSSCSVRPQEEVLKWSVGKEVTEDEGEREAEDSVDRGEEGTGGGK